MARNLTVDDLKARATALHERATRQRADAKRARRRLRAAEMAARQDALQRLGHVVEAVLGAISPEALRVVLDAQVARATAPQCPHGGEGPAGAMAGPVAPSVEAPPPLAIAEVV